MKAWTLFPITAVRRQLPESRTRCPEGGRGLRTGLGQVRRNCYGLSFVHSLIHHTRQGCPGKSAELQDAELWAAINARRPWAAVTPGDEEGDSTKREVLDPTGDGQYITPFQSAPSLTSKSHRGSLTSHEGPRNTSQPLPVFSSRHRDTWHRSMTGVWAWIELKSRTGDVRTGSFMLSDFMENVQPSERQEE